MIIKSVINKTKNLLYLKNNSISYRIKMQKQNKNKFYIVYLESDQRCRLEGLLIFGDLKNRFNKQE